MNDNATLNKAWTEYQESFVYWNVLLNL
jgi:hypothetical protein